MNDRCLAEGEHARDKEINNQFKLRKPGISWHEF
jgi:hypothetical protein